MKACRPECHVVPKDTESRPEVPSQKCRRPRLGGSQDGGWAERLEQAKMFSELSLLREGTVWRTPNLVFSHCAGAGMWNNECVRPVEKFLFYAIEKVHSSLLILIWNFYTFLNIVDQISVIFDFTLVLSGNGRIEGLWSYFWHSAKPDFLKILEHMKNCFHSQVGQCAITVVFVVLLSKLISKQNRFVFFSKLTTARVAWD